MEIGSWGGRLPREDFGVKLGALGQTGQKEIYEMLENWVLMVGATFGAVAPIANPFSAAPVFASLTKRFPDSRRKQ